MVGEGRLNRRQLLAGAGVGAIGSLLAAAGASPVLGDSGDDDSIVGSWHVSVHVAGVAAAFDVLYAFTPGGVFARVNGRRNTIPTALGNWRHAGRGIVFNYVLFAFDATGARSGTITVPSAGEVVNGTLTGSFTAIGVDNAGNPLAGFPKTGTVEGVRVPNR